jgi:hypothetical protein
MSTLATRLRRGKLPRTEEFINKVVESRRHYALRRLRNAVDHYAQRKKLPAYRDFTNKASMDYRSYPELASSAYEALTVHIEQQECIPEQWKASDSEIWGEV